MKMIKRMKEILYALFLKPSMRIGLGVLVTGGFIAGIIFWNSFDAGLKATNSEAFCVSCHTMADNVYPELKQTVHFRNRTGVRAFCSDCHVPHNFTDKIARKVQASRELWSHLTGGIGTREKFLDKRLELAQREWARMSANGSKECRSCHDYEHMAFEKMDIMAEMEMRGAAQRNTSCIECHKGIAHQLPVVKSIRNADLDKLLDGASSVTTSIDHDYYNVLPQPLYLDESLNDPIGSLEVATEVKIIEKNGDAEKVEYELWRKNKGYGRVLYGAFSLNTVSAILDKEVAEKQDFTVLETREDPLTGLEWQRIKGSAWVKKGGLTTDITPIWEVANASYTQGCSTCHVQPDTEHYDTNTWPGLFAGMVGFTNMDEDTSKVVLKYLQLHSMDFSQKNN